MDCHYGYPARFGTTCPPHTPGGKEKENDGSSLEKKQAEIDQLKADLASVKKMTLQEFRKLYEETGPETPGGAWKNKGRGGKTASKGEGKKNGKPNAGDGGGGGGGGGKGKGRKRGRGKGGGGKGKSK